MSDKKTLCFKRIYSIILSISLVLAGLCLMAGAIYIYFSGNHTYSREIVGEVFSKIALPVYACLALIVGSIIVNLIFPESTKTKANRKIKKDIANRQPDKKYTIIRISFLIVGIGLLLLGLFTGGTADVITKAVNICTECIGLG